MAAGRGGRGKENMTKARLFDYRDSRKYYNRYGIDPDRHFDKLCEKYGVDVAVDIVDRNMLRIYEDGCKKGKKGEFEPCGGAECPFEQSPT